MKNYAKNITNSTLVQNRDGNVSINITDDNKPFKKEDASDNYSEKQEPKNQYQNKIRKKMNNFTGNFKNSNIISNAVNSNINFNAESKDTKKKNKKKDKKDRKKGDLMLSSLTEQIINNLTDAIINITEAFPVTKEFANKQNALLRAISEIDAYEKISGRKILYSKEFLEKFAEIDFSNKSYKEGDKTQFPKNSY